MKLLINTASLNKGGAIQVAISFIEECKKYPQNQYYVIFGYSLIDRINKENFPPNFKFYKISYRPSQKIFSLKSSSSFLKKVEKEVCPDVVFTTSGPAYWRPKAPHLIGYNLPHYIYQDSPFFDKISLLDRLNWKARGLLIKFFFLRDGDEFVVQTRDVKQRLQKWTKTKKAIHTISNTFSEYYNTLNSKDQILPNKQPNEYRLLLFSAFYKHKDFDIITRIIDKFTSIEKSEIKFILTINEEEFRQNFNKEYWEQIINIGPVSPQIGPNLYRETDAVFLPTLLECFSASYAEAMKMQKPIITTDLGFAHSICGKAALYFTPSDETCAIEKIRLLRNEKRIEMELITNGNQIVTNFPTAEQRAKGYIEICKSLAHNTK